MLKTRITRNIIIFVMLVAFSGVVSSCHNNIPCPVYAENNYQPDESEENV